MDNKDLDNGEDKEVTENKKSKVVKSERKKIIEKIREKNPELDEEEIEEMADLFFIIEDITNNRKSTNPLKIFKRVLGAFILSFIVYMSGFGLFSYFIEIKKWYEVLLYFASLACIDRVLRLILKKVRTLHKNIIFIDFIHFILLFMIMTSFNERFDYLVFDNLLTMAIFLIVVKVVFIFLEFKIMIFRIRRR